MLEVACWLRGKHDLTVIVIIVADGSKFNRRAFTSFAPLSEIAVIVTDCTADLSTIGPLQEMGIEVLFADEPPA
ncbi:MAG: hypothetical protein SNJ59_04100 [Aggregatilineales bacterium]